MITIITATKNNRVVKYLPIDEDLANSKLLEVLNDYPEAFIYEGEYQPDLWVDGINVAVKKYEESSDQTIARLETIIDYYLDSQANLFRYESIRTMVTYENDPNPKFNSEGVGAKAFRSAVYTLGVSLIDEVQSGLREVPTEAELLTLMPKLEDFVIY